MCARTFDLHLPALECHQTSRHHRPLVRAILATHQRFTVAPVSLEQAQAAGGGALGAIEPFAGTDPSNAFGQGAVEQMNAPQADTKPQQAFLLRLLVQCCLVEGAVSGP